jgi:hypothetical protein
LNEFSDGIVQSLIDTYGEAKAKYGIRFSGGLRTQFTRFPSSLQAHKGNMDSAWLFFQMTTGYWYSGVRGFAEDDIWTSYSHGSYNRGASAANEFDNILRIPVPQKEVKRDVYINHVDENGVILAGFGNTSLDIVNASGSKTATRANTGATADYQEHYVIVGGEGLVVKKSTKTKVGTDSYGFTKGKSATALKLSDAEALIDDSTAIWTAVTKTVRTSTVAGVIHDNMVINLVYTKKPPVDVKREIYINHVDEDGNLLTGFAHSSLEVMNAEDGSETRANTDPKAGYQEHYIIKNDELLFVASADNTTTGGITYTFKGGESATGTPLKSAQNPAISVKSSWLDEVTTFSTSNVNDYVVINLIYSKPEPIKSIKREIYVNHVDEAGNLIPQFKNTSLDMVNPAGTTRASTDPKRGYQEHYTIVDNEGISVKKSIIDKVGADTYIFKYGKSAVAPTFDVANSLLPGSTVTWTLDPRTFRTSSLLIDDNVCINLVYHKEIIILPDVLPELEIVGRLDFINRDSAYIGSTSGGEPDYIPATKALTPYAQSAYPYAVRALKYDAVNSTSSASATSTANIAYTWDIWTYYHSDYRVLVCKTAEHTHNSGCYTSSVLTGTVLSCTKTEHTHTPISGSCYEHEHNGGCAWVKTNSSSSDKKIFNYTVPYRHTWFQITNFKMYRISKLEVYDTAVNKGGVLFGGGTYTVTPSGTYESRFNSSSGRILKTLTVTFPSGSYNLPAVYEPMTKPTGGTETATNTSVNSSTTAAATAKAKLDAETHVTASNGITLGITYQYDNDYIQLDGATDMLQRNYKTWYERINKETDPTNLRDLDSTRTGSGQINGSVLSYTSNLMSYMRPTSRLTTDYDFTNNYQTVPANRENGSRELKGKIYYSLVTDPKYNVGSNTFNSTDATYILNNHLNLTDTSFTDQDEDYIDRDVNEVNVLTPMNFGTFELITDKKVDHTIGSGSSTILQKNADFTITPTTAASSTGGYNLSDTREFVKGYYFIFDFNILYNGNSVEAFTPIYIAGANATLTAKTTDSFSSGAADQLTNSVKIVAISNNITDLLKTYFDTATYSNYNYMDNINNKVRRSTSQNQYDLLSRTDILNDSYHSIYKIINTKNIGRIFDFAVTDCTDLAFKDTFRKTNGVNVNETKSLAYYSGYRYWNLYSTDYNEILSRADVGSNPQKTLPLGPYKNTNTKYINAPKMGYRISFDLKTTGFMAANNSTDTRRIEITPRYYYISKDGKTFDNNSNTSLKLYYKNSNSKYVPFGSSAYTIYFKPNDGYRYLRNSIYTNNYSMMSTKLEPLIVSNKLVLTRKMMCTNNTSFIQAWYGEFKLPNSTIAVPSISGNVNNPYKDGYIGVIFDIKCIDTGGSIISYDTSDKSATTSTNTSQWDYEGFMDFKTPGSATSILRYQLEKGMWEIDNTRYQQIKGTVVLFDLDSRAANDFE